MLETYTLPRDGQRAVRFAGELLAEESGSWQHGKEHNRYYNLALYQLENRRYLVHWEYVTRWQGEAGHNQVETYSTMEEAVEALEAFDPLTWVQGFKGHIASSASAAEHYVPRQQALEAQVLASYRAQVAALCAALDITEAL